MSAGFIRYFANTDGSPHSEIGWTFMKRMIRILPVRLISMSGGLAGRWIGYEPLLTTPMTGTFVNVVCCDPSRWTWTEQVRAPAKPVSIPEFAESGVAFESSLVAGRVELWTQGVRNVLIATSTARTDAELETAKKYDFVIATTLKDAEWWEAHGVIASEVGHPYPESVIRYVIQGADQQ